MRSNSETQDGVPAEWLAATRRPASEVLSPRLRLLYHSDLGRLGWVSVAGAVPSSGEWLTVGRNAPVFTAPRSADAGPIGDPRVSREQLRVRWVASQERFEIEPAAAGRRPIGRLEPGGGAVIPINGPTLLAPGACVAIGEYALLGLELGRARAADADRAGLVGESEIMWALRDEIRSVGQFCRAALVTGPTGAGKELVARALHGASPRADGPFVPVNCAALPETLVESVLFGHKKGAFTGADADEKGLFRAADGGTLFLDELGELPLAVQPKLLRVLQDGVVSPVGAHAGKRVDVRVITATHRDLEAQVRAGGLREDLYHRLAAHVVRVPALAERRFDVPELFAHMLGLLRAEHPGLAWLWESGRSFQPAVPLGFIASLIERELRGNVRELGNLVERTARRNLEPGAFRFPDDVRPPSVDDERPAPPSAEPEATSEPLLRVAGETLGVAPRTVRKLLPPRALADIAARTARERLGDAARADLVRAQAAEALLALLEAHRFNQTAAAAELGASRTTLIKLMDDLRLPRAAELPAEEIARACQQAGGDVDAAARLLRVSADALKKRLSSEKRG